ncbi:MAG: FAD-dependent monooxygenase [Burkholderiaceae bacterium]
MTPSDSASQPRLKRPHVLIAGAGMGGLTAALSLLKRGFDVDVYEQAPELRELGAGLWISVNGARVLLELGLQDELKRINLTADDRVVRHWSTGQSWSVYNRTPGGVAATSDHTLYMLLRHELHRILIDAVRAIKPEAIHLNARCVGLQQDADGVRLQFADGSSASGDVVVGADGVHSRVRNALFGDVPGKFTGAVAWRGLVPMEKLPPEHRAPVASTWIGPTAHVTSYPVRRADGQLLMSFSGQVDRNDWQVESWSEVGSISECLNDFAGWHENIVQLVENAETLYKWGLFVREPLAQWSVGRVTLLGDACHSMVPYLGQGVNMAIEDACVLARCIAEQPDEPQQALKRYQQARRDRTALTANRSASMHRIFHHPALKSLDTAVPYIEANWSPEKVRERYDWLFSYDARQVAV